MAGATVPPAAGEKASRVSPGRELEGTVEEALPGALFRVRCDDGAIVTVSLGGVARQVMVKVIPGDRVSIEVSELDPTRGRIKGKGKGRKK
jgi:translation initiation factor IF-1